LVISGCCESCEPYRRRVIRRLVFGGFVAATVAAGFSPAAPAHAAPQCQYGENVFADCTSGRCPEVTTGQATPCVGLVLTPLLPQGPPVKVGLEGGIGVGSG
jgi:hypothetical protein